MINKIVAIQGNHPSELNPKTDTSVFLANEIQKKNYRIFTKEEFAIELKEVKKFFLYELDTYKIVFIDGIYSPFLSDTTHDGIDVCLLSAALNKNKYEKIINNYKIFL